LQITFRGIVGRIEILFGRTILLEFPYCGCRPGKEGIFPTRYLSLMAEFLARKEALS